ncbi:MAG: radical SAM protein [SAR324 cluster bacterium]|nr:radical SAM protein [SAR324 cluster bacterium]
MKKTTKLKSKVIDRKPAAFGTKEWASINVNLINGCQHDCLYCYAKSMVLRHKSIEIENWSNPEFKPGALERAYRKRKGTIMYPSVHDIHPDQLTEHLILLKKLLEAGNDLLIVSKPHLKCIKAICKKFRRYKKQILFRFSIGSANDEVLEFWEPNAPLFKERLSCLKHAYKKGFKTSVSCEPMLDNKIGEVIEKTEDFVSDSIWLGKMNQASQRCKMNGHNNEITMDAIRQLSKWQSDRRIKKLYLKHKNNPLVKWKESIKKVVGLKLQTRAGLDT